MRESFSEDVEADTAAPVSSHGENRPSQALELDLVVVLAASVIGNALVGVLLAPFFFLSWSISACMGGIAQVGRFRASIAIAAFGGLGLAAAGLLSASRSAEYAMQRAGSADYPYSESVAEAVAETAPYPGDDGEGGYGVAARYEPEEKIDEEESTPLAQQPGSMPELPQSSARMRPPPIAQGFAGANPEQATATAEALVEDLLLGAMGDEAEEYGGMRLRGAGRGGGGTGSGAIGLGSLGTIGHGAGSGEGSGSGSGVEASTGDAAETIDGASEVTTRASRGATGLAIRLSEPAVRGGEIGPAEPPPPPSGVVSRAALGRPSAPPAQIARSQESAHEDLVAPARNAPDPEPAADEDSSPAPVDGRRERDLGATDRASSSLDHSLRDGAPNDRVDANDPAALRARRANHQVALPELWTELQRTEGVATQPRDGWWANTYVPGDPELRLVHQRLTDARSVELSGWNPFALASRARPMDPVISAPTDRAISVGAHADASALEGPTRVRLEVALRGIDRAAGRRSAMRIGLVIDARRALSADEQSKVRDLLSALERARGTRDRVIVTAAGSDGGVVVPLGQMRYGEVEVGLRRVFGVQGAGDSRSATRVDLSRAIVLASEAVQSEEEVGLVLVLSPTASLEQGLESALRANADRGVTISAIGIGTQISSGGLNAIALAGQGRRRLVQTQEDASEVIRAELEAASRLVARALRLRVKLAPGVELVDVIGSHPLSAEQTRQTRASERAIDRQMETRLGIRADRDDDDTGVRILIPSFYAGDAHTVVLDLIVPRAGAVADIDVRYKDLVRLGNGTASTAVTLPAGPPRRGARENAVLANAIGQHASGIIAEAARLSEYGDRRAAVELLDRWHRGLEAVREAVPELSRDRILLAEQELCGEYASALDDTDGDQLINESMHYASQRFVVLPHTTGD